ncbi:MAG: sulfate permease [Pseudomonadales bacterium]|nr:sulfate permease [Pseudomonadales bacterium]
MRSRPLFRLRKQIRRELQAWPGYVPIIPILQQYSKDAFRSDLIAGLVVGMVTIPQAIAYAYLAGVPPEAGLYACLVPMILYAIFGSSKQMVVGPVAVSALMVATAAIEHAPRFSDAYLQIASIICLLSGLILLTPRLLRMGGLVNLLSYPVVTGFINAAVILIIINQLAGITGIPVETTANPISSLSAIWSSRSLFSIETLAIGLGTLFLLWLYKPLLRSVATSFGFRLSANSAWLRLAPMFVTLIAMMLVLVAEPSSVQTVGHVPSGLPSGTIPLFDWALWINLLPAAFVVALVSYVESYSIGTKLAAKKQDRINPHQELIALGFANVGAAFTGAYPVSGSFSRSSVNFYSGAQTPVSCLVCAVIVIFALLFLTAWFALLPHAALAAIVIVSVIGLFDVSSLAVHWKVHRHDTFIEVSTMLLVLFAGVEFGLLAGVVLSIAFFIRSSSRPNIAQVGLLEGTDQFRSIKRYGTTTEPNVLTLRIDENITFANANQIETKLIKYVQRRKRTKHLVVMCSSVSKIDATGLQVLYRLNNYLRQSDVSLHMSDVKSHLMHQLTASGLHNTLTGEIHFTTQQAMQSLRALAANSSCLHTHPQKLKGTT